MQRIFFDGNLTKDPMSYASESGETSLNFTVAVNRRFKDKNGNKVTDFFSVWVRGKQAESCKRILTKGYKVNVVGELQPKEYDKKEGGKGFSLNVVADEVTFLKAPEEKKDEGFQDVNMPDLPWEV